NVFDIAVKQGMGLQGTVQVVQQVEVARRIQAVALVQQTFGGQHVLGQLVAILGQFNGPVLLVDDEMPLAAVDSLPHARHQGIDAPVQLGAVLGGTGNNQRCARLVNQDRVDFVDDGEIPVALKTLLRAERHVVTQKVETEFVVG